MDHTGLCRRRGNTTIHTQKRKKLWIIGTYNVEKDINDVLYTMLPWADAIFVLDIGSTDDTVQYIHDYMRDYDIPIKRVIVPACIDSIELYKKVCYKNAIAFCRTLNWDVAFTDTFIHNDVGRLEIVPITQLKMYRVCTTYIKIAESGQMSGILYNLNTDGYHMVQYESSN
jgi:hypothetical protein